MSTSIAEKFRTELQEMGRRLAAVSPALADVPWRAGGWTRKQIVGHLLDSSSNNRQRFVRASIDGSYQGPTYAQDAWVAAHGYARQPWETLLRWWQAEHEILIAIVDGIPEERLQSECVVGDGTPATLAYLIEDYTRHQVWHMEQIAASVTVS